MQQHEAKCLFFGVKVPVPEGTCFPDGSPAKYRVTTWISPPDHEVGLLFDNALRSREWDREEGLRGDLLMSLHEEFCTHEYSWEILELIRLSHDGGVIGVVDPDHPTVVAYRVVQDKLDELVEYGEEAEWEMTSEEHQALSDVMSLRGETLSPRRVTCG